MGYATNKVRDEIKRKLDILDIVKEYLPNLKKTGKDYAALCPFHQDTTPSFTVSPGKQMYHCFGCNTGGDIFGFVMKYENISYPEALKKLGEKAGVDVIGLNESQEEMLERKKKEVMYTALERAADFFHNNLNSDTAKNYLEKRMISQNTATEFKLGYAPQSWNFLFNYLSKDFDPKILEETGLIAESTREKDFKTEKYYDFFRNRIIFPIYDSRNKIVGFAGRVVGDDVPVYMNSKESVIFEKGKHLYGIKSARIAIADKGLALIVEGYVDVLTLHQNGLKNVLGKCGTSFTKEQALLLKKLTDKTIECPDMDKSGIKSSIESAKQLLKHGISAKVMSLPYGDPDEFVNAEGIEKFNECMEKSAPLFEFKLEQALKDNKLKSCDDRVSLLKEMIPFISYAPSQTQQYIYLKKLSETADISGKILMKAVNDFSAGREIRKERIEGLLDEEELIHTMIKFPVCINFIKSNISENYFSSKTCKALFNYLVSYDGNSVSRDFHFLEDDGLFSRDTKKHIVDEIKKHGKEKGNEIDEDELISFIARASVFSEKQTNEGLELLLSNIKSRHERKEIAQLQEKIRDSKNSAEISALLDRYIEIEDKNEKKQQGETEAEKEG